MTTKQFYDDYLKQIQVDEQTLDDARERRDEIAAKVKQALADYLGQSIKFHPVGALAARTQIAPLNDVDTAFEAASAPQRWIDQPSLVLTDVETIVSAVITDAKASISTHAVKLDFDDETFTADIVVGFTRTGGGLHIPHCPKDEPPKWIETHPAAHAQQVRDRNRRLGSEFAREIRILKALNRNLGFTTPDQRKPLASFHITALALHLLQTKVSYAETTPAFLAQAAKLVTGPLPDPADVGPAITARNPQQCAALLHEASQITLRAFQTNDPSELKKLFGDPERVVGIAKGPVSIGVGGALLVGSGRGLHDVRQSRHHGDSHAA